jgi:redox-sensitive bicupin YhaK (pirin superfamily)
MIQVRKSEERGHARHGWLDSRHTFSFAEYQDPAHMGFRALRVINEDRVEGGKGFSDHSHRDMEIVSYVLEGELEHGDSMGNGSVIRPGDVQMMRAGTGVTHSEHNHSATSPVHFLQIWIVPDRQGLEPAYGQKHFPEDQRHNALKLVVSGDGRDGSLHVHQNVSIYAAILDAGTTVTHHFGAGRHAWIQMISGDASVNGVAVSGGDGAALTEEAWAEVTAASRCELLLFDLA